MAIFSGTMASTDTTLTLSDVFTVGSDMWATTWSDTASTTSNATISSGGTSPRCPRLGTCAVYNYTVTIPNSVPVYDPGPVFIPDAVIRQIKMADGSIIHIDAQGNFRIEDANAKVTYTANRVRNFNPYVNAGDLLARFIDYVRVEIPGIRRSDIPGLPLQVFVHWLILEAASRDGDPVPPEVIPVPESRMLTARVRPQCRLPICRRYIPRISIDTGFNYCNPNHAATHGKLLAA